MGVCCVRISGCMPGVVEERRGTESWNRMGTVVYSLARGNIRNMPCCVLVAGHISILWSQPSRVTLKSHFFRNFFSAFRTIKCRSTRGVFFEQAHFRQASGKPPKSLTWTTTTSSDFWAPEACGAKRGE